jgi:hypothetical protein
LAITSWMSKKKKKDEWLMWSRGWSMGN